MHREGVEVNYCRTLFPIERGAPGLFVVSAFLYFKGCIRFAPPVSLQMHAAQPRPLRTGARAPLVQLRIGRPTRRSLLLPPPAATAFRPCIDIHQGVVKQIVGGSLRDLDG